MTVEYLAYQLIDGYGKDDLITSFLDDYDFYLIPFVNPDGEKTSHDFSLLAKEPRYANSN
jgi:murein tripeptide amidase MpaA